MTIAWDRFELRSNGVYVLAAGSLHGTALWVIAWKAPRGGRQMCSDSLQPQWLAAIVTGDRPECVSEWEDEPLGEHLVIAYSKKPSWELAVQQLERLINNHITGLQLAIAALHQTQEDHGHRNP